MSKLEHYALDFEAIEPTLDEYFSSMTGYTHTFTQPNEYTYRVSINDGKNKKPGLINIYNRQGLYCMDIGGTPSLASICKNCSEFIVERLQIPSAERQSFTIRGVDSDVAELCLHYLGENYTLSKDKEDVPNARHFIVTDTYRSSVSVICYQNGTLYVQGACTSLFLRVVTDITKETEAVPNAVVEELIRIAPVVHKRYETEINKLVKKPKPLVDNHLDVMVLSSVILANSSISIGDYGVFTFGVLKTIEGLLALKLNSHLNRDNDNFNGCFKPDNHNIQRLCIPDFNSPENSTIKSAIESSYNFYNNNRHSTFHVKKLNVSASRILSHSEAIGIIDDGLALINKLCDNW